MKKLFMAVAVIVVAGAACAGFSSYQYRQMYAMIQPVKDYDRHYEDNALAFQFEITEKKIELQIENRGKETAEVDWPGSYFVDSSGLMHPVATNQTIFTKEMQKAKSTRIAPGTSEDNVLVPVDHVEEVEQWTWYVRPLFNMEDDSALLNLNKTFRVVIPVKVGEEKRRYSFQFMVTNVVPYRGRTPG
ncbi:MAG: hypothetical protein HZA04_00105 [Nitrospinae bacterium]|nr:hypothetical protein [Nitrospinota bacterium]